jgi:protein tyrosine phosphatase
MVGEKLKMTLHDEEVNKENTTRTIELQNLETNQTRTIHQLHYTAWPDHGVPRSATTFLSLVKMADECNDTKGYERQLNTENANDKEIRVR